MQVEAEARKVEVKQVGTEAEKAKKTEAVAGENPLISNARLRQIYRAMMQARALGKALPKAKRGKTCGLEAALVSTAVDLGPGDLVSDALAGGVVDFLRGTSLKEVLRAGKAGASASRRSRKSGTGVRGLVAGCGTAVRLPGATDAAERMWAALGAAAALKLATAQARSEAQATAKAKAEVKAKTTDMAAARQATEARQAGVVVVYALVDEASAGLWKKVLRFAAEQELPVVFVVLSAGARGGKARGAARASGVNSLAHRCGVPAIVVDADDAVAIYRVAQESIGHARIGGGAALIECAPFVLEGAAGKVRVTQDAIAGLERIMVQRGVATRAWMEREAKAFAKRLAK
jgi:TPP-dependent pyruvate/acetoin dehydrogenase alpha subunit